MNAHSARPKTWFDTLFGLTESGATTTRGLIRIDGESLTSLANGRKFAIGRFSTHSLGELRSATLAAARSPQFRQPTGGAPTLRVAHEVIGDVLALLARPQNRGATFQAASQFNCLEFRGPNVTPEEGITDYASDATQGPACALTAAAGTLFRNAFVPLGDDFGQTRSRQIEYLAGVTLRVTGIQVRTGYTLATPDGLRELHGVTREELLESVRIGLQSRVGVTFASRWIEPYEPPHFSPAYCSEASCGYQHEVPLNALEPLATLVLDAAYEATLCAAHLDHVAGRGSGKVWLTFLGGGVFSNSPEWIAQAISRALDRCHDLDLDVRIGHFRALDRSIIAALETRLERHS